MAEQKFTGRREDRRLLTGGGSYADDRASDGALHAAFVRSQVAHGRIARIDVDAARRMPGVLAIYTGADLRLAGYGDFPIVGVFLGSNSALPETTPRPALAQEFVRYVGEAIAMVVAETRELALDAAEAVAVELDSLPAVIDARDAAAPGAPRLFAHIAENCAGTHEAGDAAAVDAAFARATHRIRCRRSVSRIAPVPMEPRSALGSFSAPSRTWHLHTGSQGVRMLHATLAERVLKLAQDHHLRITTEDVGGGFGGRVEIYPEDLCVLHAARALEQPVRWRATRSEIFLIDNHARDSHYEAALALDDDGRFLAVKVAAIQSLGAYFSAYALSVPRSFKECISSMYVIPAIHVFIRCVVTNTTPTGPFRGAGRPEAAYVIESLVEEAARALNIDAMELRRRNMVAAHAFPYATPQAGVYDCGDFLGLTAKAVELADRRGFAQRRAASEAEGLLRGLGVACFIETAGGAPMESARLNVRPDGTVAIHTPTQSTGQGHATVFPDLAAERLGIAPEQIALVAGDTDLAPGGPGSGSYGSRSGSHFGTALTLATDALVEKGRRLAALWFSADPSTITYQGGRFAASGAGRSCTLGELAGWAETATNLPAELAGGLAAHEHFTAPGPTFPNGCHICEVEIDPETGVTRLLAYVAVDDCGTLINPTIVHGQMHGGIVQGIGQALGECCVFDQDGQLLTGSFLDYVMPRADDLPPIVVAEHVVPTKTNLLGAKGAGEAGTTGALAATMFAIDDALASLGIDRVEMPATPARVWAAINRGGARHKVQAATARELAECVLALLGKLHLPDSERAATEQLANSRSHLVGA